MAAQVTDYKCPACTGPLMFAKSGKLECEYCGSTYEVAEIEAMFAEANASAVDAMGKRDAEIEAAKKEAEAMGMESFENWGVAEGMKAYTCPSCTAELICDSTTAATCCPYCGNQTIVPGQFVGGLEPEFVIPFKTDKKQAKAALKKHYEGKKLLPNNFASGNHIEDIQGVYVPFWMFDATADGFVKYEGKKKKTYREEDMEITETEIYDVERAGIMNFDKVPVDAATKMPDGHMDAIEPYDYADLTKFSMAYMPGYLADRYDVEQKDCMPRMEERCKESFISAVDETVEGYTTTDKKLEKIDIKTNKVHYAMLPVWLLATKWEGKQYLFAMNGQTGKLVGDLPYDKSKYWKYVGIAFVIAAAIFNALYFFVGDNNAITFGWFFLCLLLPFLIGLIYGGMLKGAMKSVFTASANKYVTSDGLNLRIRDDIYVRTDVEKKKIENNTQK